MAAPENRPGFPRAAIVTGGARGIGAATAVRLAADGCAVTIADVNPVGEQVAADIVAAGGRAQYVETDVSSAESVRELVAKARAAYGTVDALAAIAGILGAEMPFLELTAEEWRRVLAINLDGVLHCCQALVPEMVQQKWGRIVAVTSHAHKGVPNRVPYAVSKGAVTSLIGSIAQAHAADGVLANSIMPGQALTDMIVPRYDAEYLDSPPGTPIGRMSTAEELAEVVAFMLSPRNSYAVGAVWKVDGGVFE